MLLEQNIADIKTKFLLPFSGLRALQDRMIQILRQSCLLLDLFVKKWHFHLQWLDRKPHEARVRLQLHIH